MRFREVMAVAGTAAALLAGCTTAAEPVRVGPDTYMIGGSSNTGFSSNAKLLAVTLKRADAFCSAKGKIPELQTSKTSGAQGWTTQNAQAVFKCIDDPAKTKPAPQQP